MKKKLLLGIAISAVFLYFAFRNVDTRELMESFAAADYRYVIPAVLLSLVSLWFRAIRWKYLLNPVKKIGRMSLLSATSIGLMANSVLPARLGEFIRAYVIGRKEGISKSSAFATVVVERIFDGMTVLVFFIITLFRHFHRYPEWLHNIAYIGSAVYLCALGFLVFLRVRTETASRCIAFVLKPLPHRPKTVLTRLLHSFIDGLGIIRSLRNALLTTFYSLLVWIPNALIIYVLARSFGIALPVSGAFVVMVIVAFGIMIPSAPAFVGTIQYCSVAGLSIYGVAKATALSFSVVYHICSFVPVTIAGFIFLFVEGYSLMELKDSAGSGTADQDSGGPTTHDPAHPR